MSARFPALHEIIAFILALLPFVIAFPTVHIERNFDGTLATFSYLEPVAVSLGAFACILVFGNVLILNQATPRDRRLHIAAMAVIIAIGLFQLIRGLGFGFDAAAYLAALP